VLSSPLAFHQGVSSLGSWHCNFWHVRMHYWCQIVLSWWCCLPLKNFRGMQMCFFILLCGKLWGSNWLYNMTFVYEVSEVACASRVIEGMMTKFAFDKAVIYLCHSFQNIWGIFPWGHDLSFSAFKDKWNKTESLLA